MDCPNYSLDYIKIYMDVYFSVFLDKGLPLSLALAYIGGTSSLLGDSRLILESWSDLL